MLHPQLVRRLFAVTYTYTEEPERHVKPTRHSRIRQGMTGSSSASSALTRLARALLTKQQYFFLLLFFIFSEKEKMGKAQHIHRGTPKKWLLVLCGQKPLSLRNHSASVLLHREIDQFLLDLRASKCTTLCLQQPIDMLSITWIVTPNMQLIQQPAGFDLDLSFSCIFRTFKSLCLPWANMFGLFKQKNICYFLTKIHSKFFSC